MANAPATAPGVAATRGSRAVLAARAPNRPLIPENYAKLRGVIETAVQHRLGPLAAGKEIFGRTQTGMALATDPTSSPPPPGAPAGPFLWAGFPKHSHIIEGHWPQRPGTSTPTAAELDAVVGQRVANNMGYAPGSHLYITPFRGAPKKRLILNLRRRATPIPENAAAASAL